MTPCHECVLRPRCGGLVKDGEAEYTCMLRCGQCRDKHGNCPFACPNNEARFTMMVGEVKSLTYKPVTKLVSPQASNWSLFAPQIYHGSRRSRPLHAECVSISIKSLLAETKPGDGPSELRKIFKLEESTRVIGLGVARDHLLEKWWGERAQVAERLARLGLDGVTTPNFSVFSNAPRPQTMVSIARIHHFSEALSAAGAAVMPHVYAETDHDWEQWKTVLRDQPNVHAIAMEFQTGLLKEDKAHRYIERLVELRDAIGRPLHLVAVGGTKYASQLLKAFPGSFTVTDATSFIKTLHRRRVDSHSAEQSVKMAVHEDLADLLQQNIDSRELKLRRKLRLPMPAAAVQLAA